MTQWRETDLQFIQRILSEVGIYWRTEMDDERGLDVYIFADSQLNYRFDVRLPYCEPSGLYDGAEESVWGVRTRYQVVPGRVSTGTTTTAPPRRRWIPPSPCEVRRQPPGALPLCRAVPGGGDDTTPEPKTESGAFYARIHHERELNAWARVSLESNAA